MILSVGAVGESSWSLEVRGLVYGFGFLVLLTVVAVAVLRAWVQVRTARDVSRDEERLRDLVERFERVAQASQEATERTAGELAQLRASVTAIEQLLRSVE